MLSEDIDHVLTEYYRWSQEQDPGDIGYPHVDPVRRLLGSSVAAIGLSDDEAMWVDRALQFLSAEAPDQHWIIDKLFRERRSITWVARRRKMDRRTVSSEALAAKHFIFGVMSGAIAAKKTCGTGLSVPQRDW